MDTQFNSDEINKKLAELEQLKHKVEKLLNLSNIGEDVKQEFEEFKALKSTGVVIPHLEKQFSSQIYPKRKFRGRNTKPILQSELQEAIDRTSSASEASRVLGVSYATFKKYSRLYKIHQTKGWPRPKSERGVVIPRNPFTGKYPINEVLAGRFPNLPVHRLKDKLIRSNIKKAECEQCGFHERRLTDGKLPLLLNFEDGNNHNHKLENLRILCYNCTFTCGRGYISKGRRTLDPDMLQDSDKVLNQRF